MEPIIYTLIAVATIIVLVVVFFVARMKIKRRPGLDVDVIFMALGEDNIREIDFKRSKINVTLKNHKNADKEALKAAGATGINVVGNKIKFYFDEDTETVYESLRERYDANVEA